MILTALADLYERMAEVGQAPRRGFASVPIGAEVEIDCDGRVLRVASRLMPEGKRMVAGTMNVPVPVKRTVGIAANRFWDKTAYALGVTVVELPEGGVVASMGRRTEAEHAAFRNLHCDLLSDAEDPGLAAFLRFLESWNPADFAASGYPMEVLDQNVVFRLPGGIYLHERAAALGYLEAASEASPVMCLVTGDQAAPTRLHPSLKGVAGAQSSGASLVSFNKPADESYGKVQGANAPVSEPAAFAYGTALNTLLSSPRHHIRVGDATVVFWAETERRDTGSAVEEAIWFALSGGEDDIAAQNKLRAGMTNLAQGRAAPEPGFDPETRVYVLGLAPNAARLSVRFWQAERLGDLAGNVTRFWDELHIEPSPWKGIPAAWGLLYETALQAKAENIPPRLGGDLMRAVLTGGHYLRTLLAGVIGRIRADGQVNGRRAAIARAFVARNIGQEVIPVALDPDNPSPAYRLGRLFAVLEGIQRAALPGLNATIKDRWFAAASATPARVFPVLVKNATHHLALMRKGESGGLAHWLEMEMGAIWAGLEPDLPRSLTLEDQGRFVAGYYHQRFTKRDRADKPIVEDAEQ